MILSTWLRYVDDVLCLWTESVEALQAFLAHLNYLYPSIKFTLEIGRDSIPCLDVRVILSEGTLKF